MNRVLELIFAFNGDIYGNAIFKQLGGPSKHETTDTIQCRLDPHLIRPFINVLKLDFERVNENRATATDPILHLLYLQPCSPHMTPVYLSIIACSSKTWRKLGSDFDVNIISQNKISLYTRCETGNALPYHDINMHQLIKRVLCGRFSIWDHNPLTVYDFNQGQTYSNPMKHAILMSKAVCMLNDGWWMDDMFKGPSTWVISKWIKWKTTYMTIRIPSINKQPSNEYIQRRTQCLSLNECAICKEEFKDDDIVVNLRCNHNFHVYCDPHHHGLEAWLRQCSILEKTVQDHDGVCATCPMCRTIL